MLDASRQQAVKGFAFFTLVILLAGLFGGIRSADTHWLVELGFVLSMSTAISIVIWQACDPFADAAQWVGHRGRIPPSVRGATLDAVASSMPELFTGIFFVLVALSGDKNSVERLRESAEGYGSTIATCAGSSIYNMILIPAICAIAISYSRRRRPAIDVAKGVIHRDGAWVIGTQFGLLIFLFQPELSWWMALVALFAYLVYVVHLYWDTKRYRTKLANAEVQERPVSNTAGVLFGLFDVRLNAFSAAIVLALTSSIAAVACYFLVELTNSSAARLGVPPFFVAVILTAAVSSIPDTFVSLGSARRGDDEGALANVFGSNIFDICIGMSIPLIVSCYLNDWQPLKLIGSDDQTLRGVIGLRVFLFLLTAIVMFVLWRYKRVTRRTAWLFCCLYVLFISYAVLGALDVIPV